jgi:hypothetical protein
MLKHVLEYKFGNILGVVFLRRLIFNLRMDKCKEMDLSRRVARFVGGGGGDGFLTPTVGAERMTNSNVIHCHLLI